MLIETRNVSQVPNQPRRRWFSDSFFELIVWYGDDKDISSFQLCYDKDKNQRALTWKRNHGYSHNRVDDGENTPGQYKGTPILVVDGKFDTQTIADRFQKESVKLEPGIRDLVYAQLLAYGK